MSEPDTRLYARFGDADCYHIIGGYIELGDELLARRIRSPLSRHNEFAVETTGYRGDNHISLYYGTDLETPVRGLTDEELAYVNNYVARNKSKGWAQ